MLSADAIFEHIFDKICAKEISDFNIDIKKTTTRTYNDKKGDIKINSIICTLFN